MPGARRSTRAVAVREPTPLEPWDKQKGESAKAFEAFALYRDIGAARSLTIAARRLHEAYPERFKSGESARATVAEWSSRWQWQARIEAFELAEDRARRERRRQDVEEMERQHRGIAQQLQTAALVRMRGATLPNGDRVDPLSPGQIETWQELSSVAKTGAMLERLTLGLPTDLTKGLDSFPFSDVLSLVGDLTDYALDYMDGDMHETFLRRVRDRLSKMGGAR